ncbi:DUF2231 domain-containing protein [Cereibacter sphaeroides f. sp. denitrificans]
MTDKQVQTEDDTLIDPISSSPDFEQTESRIAIWGHPTHAMTARALWAAGTAFLFGLAAGVTGTTELLMVPGIRARAAAWTHFVIAVALLSVLGANWGYRLGGYEEAVLPYGLLLSAFGVVMVSAAGWHGGKLVFDYRLGTSKGS